MQFRLLYRGPLTSATSDRAKKVQTLRRAFHPQLAFLWKQLPLSDQPTLLSDPPEPAKVSVIEQVGPFRFAPLVTARLNLVAELDILFLRPEPPGELLKHGGDLDNRVKTLLDGLRKPSSPQEIPTGDAPAETENPFHCLLQDDALVTHLSVTADRLLDSPEPSQVSLVIHVRLSSTRTTWSNIGLV